MKVTFIAAADHDSRELMNLPDIIGCDRALFEWADSYDTKVSFQIAAFRLGN